MADSVGKRIQELEVSIKKFQLGVKDVVDNGEKAKKTYKELLEEFNKIASTAERLVTASKNSFSQTQNNKQYLSFLTKINTGLNNISSSYNKLEKAEKKSLSKREEIQKKWDDRKFQRFLSRAKKEQADRIAAEKRVQQKRESIQKQWDERKRTRRNAARKKETSRRVAAEKEAQKKLEAERKKQDFGGGFRGQLTPRAIGGALGSLTKYLGLYQAINAAQRIFTALTIGSVKQSIAFEKALANLGAVAGATSEEVKTLSENALSVAGSTKFTAIEIVSLQTELSKLGFTADDVVASTEAIAFAAQALGSNLGATAEQVGKVINQFGLVIEQAGFVSDVLVTSINNSALSFDSFGTAIQYVGPIARNLGLSLEQTAGAMAVLADNGFTASRVGTGLRGIFTEIGKTSADVESSLKKLAKQNISLSEAVDLVGKRNAAQLITLLKNIDAIDKGNDKYYQQGRALESAAKNVDNFAGQMGLLNSAFVEFQIGIGDSIAKSNILLGILDGFSPKTAKIARGFKAINELGFETFNNGAKKVENGADALSVSLELLGESQSKYNAAVQLSNTNQISIGGDLLKYGDKTEALKNKVEGLRDALLKYAEEGRQQTLITEGQTIATDKYETSIIKLTQAFENQINVNDQVNSLAAELSSEIENLNTAIETGIKSETDAFNTRTKMVKVTDDEIKRYKGLVGVLTTYLEMLTNIVFNEDAAASVRESKQRKALNIDLRNIKERSQAEIDAINERAFIETELAKTAEERADIEANRAKDVSNVYTEQAVEIRKLSTEYDTQTEAIERSAVASEKLAKVLGSDVIKDLNKAFSDYSKEIDRLQETLDSADGKQEDYDAGVAKLRASLVATIGTFKTLFGTSPELDEFFNNILDKFDLASKKVKDVDNAVQETFGQALRTELLDSLDDALNTVTEAISKFNDVALENTKAAAQSELDVIKNRYETEEDILKSQLDNQLITESQFRSKQKELQKSKAAEENSINKQIFDAEQKRDRQNATSDYAQAIASIIPTLIAYDKTADPISVLAKAAITGALATASFGAELAAINQKKFFPTRFADGGVVNGPSHAQGGVPFSVQGRGGYEMEGGEFIVNKDATSRNYDLLRRINDSTRLRPTTGKLNFAQGGLVSSPVNESVDYLKAIAEATTSTAIGVSKPVRAYVADKDLRTDSTERRIRDRNDRI